MRIINLAAVAAITGLAACMGNGGNTVPSMSSGVGFGDYQRYLRDRETGPRQSAPYSVPPEGGAPMAASGTIASTPLDGQPATGAPMAAPMVTMPPVGGSPMQAAAPIAGTQQGFGTTPAFVGDEAPRRGVSDEQDFNAVAARETIESDRERLAQQRAQYQVVEVTSVPDASVRSGPNVIEYALATQHPVGTQMHRRLNPLRWSRWENACLQFHNQDAAQEAFLAAGGPERDSNHLDPDGDGYACWWDPAPYRQAVRARQ